MRARIAASVLLSAGILLGTSGCNLYAPQATTIQYDASDGVSGNVGDVGVRNVIVLSEDGETANVLVSLVNQGDAPVSLNVQYEAASGKVTQTITVNGNSVVSLGAEDAPALVLENVDVAPGTLFPIFFQYGEETGVEVLAPVLDGTLITYSTLLPEAPDAE